jgi:hypothetical protein
MAFSDNRHHRRRRRHRSRRRQHWLGGGSGVGPPRHISRQSWPAVGSPLAPSRAPSRPLPAGPGVRLRIHITSGTKRRRERWQTRKATSVKSEGQARNGDTRPCLPAVLPHEPLALIDIPVRPDHKPDTSLTVQPR